MPEVRGTRPGGRILVDALRLHGVDRLFCVPGESFLDVTANKGGLNTVATTGDATGIAQAINDTDIRIVRAV